MRFFPLPAALLAATLMVPPAQAEIWSVYNINGNDTGGIIPWSPQLRAYGYREAAQHHCAGYKKIARVTSVCGLRKLRRLRVRVSARLRSGGARRLVVALVFWN